MSGGLDPLAFEAKSHRFGGGFFFALACCWLRPCVGGVLAYRLLEGPLDRPVAQSPRIAIYQSKTLRGNPETEAALANI
jgi:hypothetical protein